MAGRDRDVIPLHALNVAQPAAMREPAITLAWLRAAAQQLDELRHHAERVALDPQSSAMEWRATCAPLVIRLPGARDLLASLSPIRVGQWPDTEWAARVRAIRGDIERRLQDVGFAMSALTSDESSNPDAAVVLTADASLLAAAASDLRALITSRYPAAASAGSWGVGPSGWEGSRSLDNEQRAAPEIAEDLPARCPR